MSAGFLPVKDLDLVDWSRNFCAELSKDPEGYGVTPEDAASFAALQQAFAAKVRLAKSTHRSRVIVAAKDMARLALEADARRLNAMIRGSGVVGSDGLLNLGLTVYKTKYRRIGPPAQKPDIVIRRIHGPLMWLQLTPSDGGGARLPTDVHGAAVYRFYGDEPPTDLSRWTLVAHVARASFTVTVEAPAGTKVHFAAYYLNRRGEQGPISDTRSTHSMGGLIFPTPMAA